MHGSVGARRLRPLDMTQSADVGTIGVPVSGSGIVGYPNLKCKHMGFTGFPRFGGEMVLESGLSAARRFEKYTVFISYLYQGCPGI